MFNTKQVSITVLFTVIVLLFVGVAFVDAGDWYFYYALAPSSFNCSPNRVVSNDGTIVYALPGNAQINSYEYLNGSLYARLSASISGTGRHSFPVFSSTFPTQQSYPYSYRVTYVVSVGGNLISQSSIAVRCNSVSDGVVVSSDLSFGSGEAGVIMPPDDRFNWGYGDSHIAILYPEAESIGLYLYAGEQYISNFVTAADLEPYADNPPSENTLIASVGAVDVYVLTTGELQFNIGPDAEGKQYVLIMSDIDGSDSYGYYIDPNE